jgi:hypothetical protein
VDSAKHVESPRAADHQVQDKQRSSLCTQSKHMGQPSQWVPIGGVRGRKGPNGPIPGQTGLHMAVLSDIAIVIVVDKIIISHLRKDSHACHDQK